jgi:hypothetical protein
MATRYKLTKDQLERIVENFVMESANIEGKKAPVKNHIPSQSADAKKHVKKKISGDMVEPSEGVPVKPPVMKKKLSQSADAKKHVSNSKMKHSNKAKVVKEEQKIIKEFLGEFSDVDVLSAKQIITIVVSMIGIVGAAAWRSFRDPVKKKLESSKHKEKAEEIIDAIDEKVGKKPSADLKNKITNMDKDMGNKNL